MEQRRTIRFRSPFPVIFRWENQTSVGLTRDISTAGAFVICDALPPVGASVTLEVTLPPFERNSLQPLYLKATGTVRRVERGVGGSGFAVNAPFALHELLIPCSHTLASRLVERN